MRTDTTERAYEEYIAHGGAHVPCPLCEAETITMFDHWRIIPNRFPYDRIAEYHRMLIPEEHVKEMKELPHEAQAEYERIEQTIQGFDALLKNFPDAQSITEHFHVHLLTYKDVVDGY